MAPRVGPAEFTFGYIHPITGERCGPFPKQRLAHICPADITFFGGAAGPGKSEFDVVEAVTTCLEFPGCEVALFRRKHTELEKSLIPRFLRLVPKHVARYNATLKRATFNNGSLLWFCHCQHESTVYDYQSAQWILFIFDESTHGTQFQIDYLSTRVRTVNPRWRKRVILTSNPGNRGHGTHKRRFVKPPTSAIRLIVYRFDAALQEWEKAPGATFDQAKGEWSGEGFPLPLRPMDVWQPHPEPNDNTPPAQMRTRCFIPARLEDNPALEEADPTYRASLNALGGAKARQLADGDWDANDTMILGPDWHAQRDVAATDRELLRLGYRAGEAMPWHVIDDPTWRPPRGALLYGSVDYGFGAPWAFHLHAALTDRHTRTFAELYYAGVRDEQQAALIRLMLYKLQLHHDPRWRPDQPLLAALEWLVYEPVMKGSRKEVGLAKSIIEVYEDTLGDISDARLREILRSIEVPGLKRVAEQLPAAWAKDVPRHRHLRINLLEGAGGRSARMSRPQRWKAALAQAPDGFPGHTFTTACPEAIRSAPEVPWDEEDPEVDDGDSENHCYEGIGRFFEARPHVPLPSPADPLKELDPASREFWQGQGEGVDKTPGRLNLGNFGPSQPRRIR